MSFALSIHDIFVPVRDNPTDETTSAAAATKLADLVKSHAAQARLIGALTLGELVPYSVAEQRAGLYVVFYGGQPVYVGTCRSQPYLVRLAAHLAAGAGDYMNSLTKARHRVAPAGANLLVSASAVAKDCSILLLTVEQRREATAEERKSFVRALITLEHQLQNILNTTWNNPAKQAKKTAIEMRIAGEEDAESARIEHEVYEALADGEDDVAWQAAALKQLGVTDGWGLVVKVRGTWRAEDDGATRQAAVVGDWACSHAAAKHVRVVVGVANARIVEAWLVDGFDIVGEDRVRFHPVGSSPLDITDVPMSEDMLRARGHRYLRPQA
jgi:hypothetical protein